MKLVKAHVTNYRNVIDSGEVQIDGTTCLVGKNEAGKTAFLRALEGLRSTNSDFSDYGKTENYPRRYLSDYEERHSGDAARVVKTEWELTLSDKNFLENVLGKGSVTRDLIVVSKFYDSDSTIWTVGIDHSKVIQHLANKFSLSTDEMAPLNDCKSTKDAFEVIENMEEPSGPQIELKEALGKFRKNDADLKAIDLMSARMPKFLYFSHYDRMSGEISINQLNKDKSALSGISSGDQVFLDFLEYAGTDLDELAESTKFEELNAKCEGAANKITDQIFEYWTQNDELQIKIALTEGKQDDEPPFNSGVVARARVENNLHRVTVPFSERSAGFIWFFSFLIKFAQIKKAEGNVILLLDEPGLTLHGTAQKDLLRYFKEQIEPNHQLIFSTHSPFMVPADELNTVRTVEDVVTLDDRNRKQSHGTKVRGDVLTTDPQTNFPIFGAMGFEVTQNLIIAENTLLVEGPSDILYLQAASAVLKKAGRPHLDPHWAICPTGGIDKVLPFVRLFYGNKLNVVVLTDFERGQKRKLDDLYKAELLENDRILLATQIAEKDEADIEDFFEPSVFVKLVNATYELKDEHALTVDKLDKADEKTERLVKKAEAYFRLLPNTYPTFSHFDPAMHLLANPKFLVAKGTAVEKTLERFENAIKRINKFI